MSLRLLYKRVRDATQGVGGNMNCGIVVVKNSVDNLTYIEKRIDIPLITSQVAQREISVMQKIKQRSGTHPNIVFIVDYDLDWTCFGYGSVYMQYCELGSLDMLITRYQDQDEFLADDGFIWKVLWDLSLALCYLWTGNDDNYTRQLAKQGMSAPLHHDWYYIVHCDIKPSNIFLTWVDHACLFEDSLYPTVVLGDFGCSVSEDDIMQGYGCHGDRSFEAPEAPSASQANNVYGLGLIIYCLASMTQKPDSDRTLLQDCPVLHDDASEDLENLVGECLNQDPYKRPLPHDLPKLVWSGYLAWRVRRTDAGALLPKWALPSS